MFTEFKLCISDVDLSKNNLPRVPDALYTLPNMKRLNLSENSIIDIASDIGGEFIYLFSVFFYIFFLNFPSS